MRLVNGHLARMVRNFHIAEIFWYGILFPGNLTHFGKMIRYYEKIFVSGRYQFNPYWQILENLSRNFSKFQFPGHDRFLENSSTRNLPIRVKAKFLIRDFVQSHSKKSEINAIRWIRMIRIVIGQGLWRILTMVFAVHVTIHR